MVTPLLGTGVIFVLAIFVWNYRQVHIDQLQEMRSENLHLIKEIGQIRADFSENHSRVFQLLIDVQTHADEGAFYRAARPALNTLHELEAQTVSVSDQHALSAEIRSEIEELNHILTQYRMSASNALLMATVDFSLAETFVVDAAERYNHASGTFNQIENTLQKILEHKIETYSADLSAKTTNLGLIFIGTVVFMLSLSAWLARVLSSDLRKAVVNLGAIAKPGAHPEIGKDGRSETAMLAEAIDGARETHAMLVEAERALRDSEQQLRAVFDNNIEALIVADERGTITALNRTAEELFDYNTKELLGQNISVLVDETDQFSLDDHIDDGLNSDPTKVIGMGGETTAVRNGGKRFPVHLGIGAFEHDGQRAFIATISDLSERKSLETQLRRSQKMEAIGELTGGIAHDFNNLLAIIIGNLDLAKRVAADNETITKRLNEARDAAARGANLTRRLLSFSSQSVEACSPVDINRVIEELRDLMGKSLTSRISLELRLGQDLWMAEIDPRALEDVLINLAINARDAMPDGGRLIIETSNRVANHKGVRGQENDPLPPEFVEISVTDTGSGIPAEIREKIFDPFFTTKHKGKGTGLGLSMAYGFAKRSNGHIAVHSEEGVGSTFKLCLPKSERQAPEQKMPESVERTLPRGSETILIVDDEEALLDVSSRILTELGYRTLRASNGDRALAILQETPSIDLLFTDVVMPGSLNGLALAHAAREFHPGLKVLLTSGFTGKIPEADESGDLVRSMLRKPYDSDDLAIYVRRVLDRGEKDQPG